MTRGHGDRTDSTDDRTDDANECVRDERRRYIVVPSGGGDVETTRSSDGSRGGGDEETFEYQAEVRGSSRDARWMNEDERTNERTRGTAFTRILSCARGRRVKKRAPLPKTTNGLCDAFTTSQVHRLMDLIVNSLYNNKDVFA